MTDSSPTDEMMMKGSPSISTGSSDHKGNNNIDIEVLCEIFCE